ncbi:MAG: hypothetical protein ACRYGL_20710, partial [Janthinobacterium lividum]
APPSAAGSTWMRRFGTHGDGFASGWMRLRGARRRRGVDRGFVLSDHADWPGLQQAIGATGASRVIVTHGSVASMVRWLSEQGLEAGAFSTEYGDEDDATASGGSGGTDGGAEGGEGKAGNSDADRHDVDSRGGSGGSGDGGSEIGDARDGGSPSSSTPTRPADDTPTDS